MPNASQILTQAQLQHIEHCNKVLNEHLELVQAVVNASEGLLNTFVPVLSEYCRQVAAVGHEFGTDCNNIYKSSRELKIAVGGVQDIVTFMDQVKRLDAMLSPELLEKLRRISNG